jgi:hypothetical protein
MLCRVLQFRHNTGCCYAECRYVECHYAECRYAECRYAECRGALKPKSADYTFLFWSANEINQQLNYKTFYSSK